MQTVCKSLGGDPRFRACRLDRDGEGLVATDNYALPTPLARSSPSLDRRGLAAAGRVGRRTKGSARAIGDGWPPTDSHRDRARTAAAADPQQHRRPLPATNKSPPLFRRVRSLLLNSQYVTVTFLVSGAGPNDAGRQHLPRRAMDNYYYPRSNGRHAPPHRGR